MDRFKIMFENLPKLKHGDKIEFKWHGSDSLYTGRIEVGRNGGLYFVNEFCYENDKIKDIREPMRYYNPLDSFVAFQEFRII